MLRVMYGTDAVAMHEAVHTQIVEAQKRGVVIERIEAQNCEPGMLESYAGAVSLFGVDTLYIIDTPSQTAEYKELVLSALPVLTSSSATFIVLEGTLLAAEKKHYAAHATALEEYKSAAQGRFNTFALADSLAKRDKRTLWVQFQAALAAGCAVEEIVGVLWWQLKTLRLAACTDTAASAGLKDFPYRKAKQALAAFKAGELEQLSQSLLAIRHESRLGRSDLTFATEQWILSL